MADIFDAITAAGTEGVQVNVSVTIPRSTLLELGLVIITAGAIIVGIAYLFRKL